MSRANLTSIKNKLHTIILATAGTVLVISFLMLTVMEIDSAKQASETKLRALAKVLGANSAAALTFLDKKSAENVLNTLKTQEDVNRAQLIISSGELFVEYRSSIKAKNNDKKGNLFYQSILIVEPIYLKTEKIGSISIEGDMSAVRKKLFNQAQVGLIVLLISMLLAIIISNRLQRIVSEPINNLLETMKSVSTQEDFSQRAERLSNDELGLLADGFNDMLEHIQSRDQELTLYREKLEHLVDERTSELAEKNKELVRVSRTDWLTGLSNRLRLDEILEQEILRSTRYDKVFSLIIMDIDKFKQINDNFGHEVGDKTLIELANLLRLNVRESDTIGRWGGDEFLLICPETEQAGVIQVAEHIRQQIDDHTFPVIGQNTSSFGVSTYQKGDDIELMMKRADTALLLSKERGRNRVEIGEL